MRTNRIVTMVAAVAALTWALPAAAQIHKRPGAREASVRPASTGTDQTQAAASDTAADEAIAQLARWRHGEARKALESAGTGGALETAWGLLLAEEGQVDDGIARLRAAVAARPADPAPAYWLGETLQQFRRDNAGATTAWREAAERAGAILEHAPKDARASFYAGAAGVRLKTFDAARNALATAAAEGWDRAMTAYQEGLSWAFEQKWSDADARLTAALEADPSYAHAWYYRALCREKLKRTSEMLSDLQRFLQLAPDAPEAATAQSILHAAGY